MDTYVIAPVSTGLDFINTVPGLAIKAIFIAFLLSYVLFSFVVVRQVQQLTKTLHTALSPVLRIVTVLNVFLALFCFFLILFAF